MRLSPDRRATRVVRVAERWVDGGRRGQHVARVAEGRQVAHVGHVGSHGTSSAGKGQRLVVHALGKVVEALRHPLVSLGLAGHLAVACLDAFFLHRQWSVDLQRAGQREKDVRSAKVSISICAYREIQDIFFLF